MPLKAYNHTFLDVNLLELSYFPNILSPEEYVSRGEEV